VLAGACPVVEPQAAARLAVRLTAAARTSLLRPQRMGDSPPTRNLTRSNGAAASEDEAR
jgi:hypothetical protein